MSTAEHLERITAKCRELLADADARRQDFIEHGFTFDHQTTAEEAGWNATIAACEVIAEIKTTYGQNTPAREYSHALQQIITAAWPEEIL